MVMYKLFNPEGSDRLLDREILNGNTTRLVNLNSVRYKWASQLYQQMAENFWIPEKVDLTNDIKDYQALTPDELRAFKGILAYLIFLDSIQLANLPRLMLPITAPEIGMCMAMQLQQESIHAKSYQVLIEAVIPKDYREGIYSYVFDDEKLRARCQFVADIFQRYEDTRSDEDYAIALIADYMLEGLYFYTGFQFFYNLSSRHLMQGCADMITYINRDELSHVRLYQKILQEVLQLPQYHVSEDKVQSMFLEAAYQEIDWCQYIIGDGVLGLSPKVIEDYIHWLTNTRLRAIGFKPVFESADKNPLSHLETIADIGKDANMKSNFFENTVTSYNIATALDGWDEF